MWYVCDCMVGINEPLAVIADVMIEHRAVMYRHFGRHLGLLEMLTEMFAHEGVDFSWVKGDGCGDLKAI